MLSQTGTHLERNIFCLRKLFIISQIYGGGGGSRTPVRKALRPEAYMLSSIPFGSPTALRMSKKRRRLVRGFSPAHHGPRRAGQPTVGRLLPGPQAKPGEEGHPT